MRQGPFGFGATSSKAMASCCDPLIEVCELAIGVVDFAVIQGHRGEAEQNSAVLSGHSKVLWPHGKHNSNPSLALDFVPWPVDWDDLERFIHIAYLMRGIALARGVNLRLGCDWNSDFNTRDTRFMDAGHIEVVKVWKA